jgi:hypothetical protein
MNHLILDLARRLLGGLGMRPALERLLLNKYTITLYLYVWGFLCVGC